MIIPEYKIEIIPISEEAEAEMGFEWADDEVGKRSKLGGKPDLLQEMQAPTCAACGNAMSFYAQIDSIGDNISLADVGMIYTFVCFDCFEVTSLIQSG